MKRLISLALALVMCLSLLPSAAFAADGPVAINNTNFPDSAFRNFVRQYDGSGDGFLAADERNSVTRIVCTSMGIDSIQGIEFFPNLEILYCGGNFLTDLDVSSLSRLEVLGCSENPLRQLDVTHNAALTDLDCFRANLHSLDLTHNPNLTYLRCGENHLSVLDLTHNPLLTVAYTQNQSFEALDGAPAAQVRPGYDPDVIYFDQGGDVVDGKIRFVHGLDTMYGYSRCGNGDRLSLIVHRLTVPQPGEPGGQNVPISAETFPDEVLRKFITKMIPGGSDGVLTPEELAAVTSIDCSGKGIHDLTGIEQFPHLSYIDCSRNELRELHLSGLPQLQKIDASKNKLETVIFSHLGQLYSVNLSANRLRTLDVRSLSALESLSCSDNQLTSLDLASNSAFKSLNALDNRLTVPQGASIAQVMPGFDLELAGEIQGGSLSGGQVLFDQDSDTITYRYTCARNQSVTFTLLRSIPAPKLTCYAANEVTGIPFMQWERVEGASSYHIYEQDDQGNLHLLKNTRDTEYTPTDTQLGSTHIYRVCAVFDSGRTSELSPATAVTHTCARPSLSADEDELSVHLSWPPVSGASRYELQRSADAGPWQVLCLTNAFAYVDRDVSDGHTYAYRIRALHTNPQANSAFSLPEKVSMIALSLPKLTVSARSDGKPVLTWTAVPYADHYEVRYSVDDGSFTHLMDVSGTRLNHTSAQPGHTYAYRVRACSAGSNSWWSDPVNITVLPDAPS